MPNSKPKATKEKRAETYGDASFKGNGFIKCAACGEKLSEHPYIGPCESLAARLIYTQGPRTPKSPTIKR